MYNNGNNDLIRVIDERATMIAKDMVNRGVGEYNNIVANELLNNSNFIRSIVSTVINVLQREGLINNQGMVNTQQPVTQQPMYNNTGMNMQQNQGFYNPARNSSAVDVFNNNNNINTNTQQPMQHQNQNVLNTGQDNSNPIQPRGSRFKVV